MQFFRRHVYADAAAATPLSPASKRELMRLLSVYGNPGGLHREAQSSKNELEAARERVAATLGAHADEIIFTSGGTEANNLAIRGTIEALIQAHGEVHAITTVIEHPSVLLALRALYAEKKISLTELKVNEEGRISLDELKNSITPRTAFISIQMVNSEVGTIQDIREVAKIVRQIRQDRTRKREQASKSEGKTWGSGPERPSGRSLFPLYLHCDASQAPLWLKLQVEKLGIDLMTLDGQKICAPKGVGALYIKRGTAVRAVELGGGQEKGLRSGTENVPLIGAFAVALEEAQSSVEDRAAKVAHVRDVLWKEIQKSIPDATLNGSKEFRVANNCNISIEGLPGDMATVALNTWGVSASVRSACSTEDEEPSHVLLSIGATEEIAKSALRLTLLPNVRAGDATYIAYALTQVAKQYKNVLK